MLSSALVNDCEAHSHVCTGFSTENRHMNRVKQPQQQAVET